VCEGCERIERTGPPIAPRNTASAFLAAVRASSVSGMPLASIEACAVIQWRIEGRGAVRGAYAAEEVFLEIEGYV